MPIHSTALISRHKLENPDEKDPPTVEALSYERVLKYNPHHDPHSGKFTSGGGGRRGGTVGAPTQDAFGRAIGRGRSRIDPLDVKSHPAGTIYSGDKVYIPTGEKGKIPFAPTLTKNHPGGTMYIGNKVYLPEEGGKFREEHSGAMFQMHDTSAASAQVRRQNHPSFQRKSGHKHALNPAKTTFRI